MFLTAGNVIILKKKKKKLNYLADNANTLFSLRAENLLNKFF